MPTQTRTATHQPPGLRARPILQDAFRLHDQPSRPEQCIAEHQTDRRQDRERRQPVERSAGEEATIDPEPLHECAKQETLCERGDQGAIVKSRIPAMLRLGRSLEAQLERDAAKDECHQHDQDREVDRRQNDSERERKGGEQRDAAQHEPSLVAVPDRCHRVHHDVAGCIVRGPPEQDADTEIKSIHQHIHEDAKPQDQRPQRHEVERHHGRGSVTIGVPAADPPPRRPRHAPATVAAALRSADPVPPPVSGPARTRSIM